MKDESIAEEFEEGTYTSEQAEKIYKRFRETMGKETVLIKTEYSLSFEKNVTYPEQCLDDFSDMIKSVARELGFPVFAGDALDWFEEDDYNSFEDERFYGENGIPRHQIGGYPFYTQNDVRREGDILLFQLDSENRKGICWGDMGIANFFISLEDLKKRDFSNVIYNWDCY